MAEENSILVQRIRNPRSTGANDKWFKSMYITDTNEIHLYGYLDTDDAVKTNNIENGAVTAGKLGKNAVTGDITVVDDITGEKSVTLGNIATDAVQTRTIKDLAVTRDKIDDKAINGSKIAEDAITVDHLLYYVGVTTKIANGEGIRWWTENEAVPDNYKITLNYSSNG